MTHARTVQERASSVDVTPAVRCDCAVLRTPARTYCFIQCGRGRALQCTYYILCIVLLMNLSHAPTHPRRGGSGRHRHPLGAVRMLEPRHIAPGHDERATTATHAHRLRALPPLPPFRVRASPSRPSECVQRVSRNTTTTTAPPFPPAGPPAPSLPHPSHPVAIAPPHTAHPIQSTRSTNPPRPPP